MKQLLITIVCLFSLEAGATFITTGITGLDVSPDPAEDVLVMATSGDVLWAPSGDARLLATLKTAIETKQLIELEVTEKSLILRGKLLLEKVHSSQTTEFAEESNFLAYEPTRFSTLRQITQAFTSMERRTRSGSQCYNRAYVWGHDLWQERGVNSMKLFLFFTTKYIREFRYKWWFHVSPMSYLGDEEYVMDRLFTRRPLRPQTWTNIFMHNNAVCKSVTDYADYHKDDPVEYCFLIRSTMYYYGPTTVRLRDQGVERTKWNSGTLRAARREAFF